MSKLRTMAISAALLLVAGGAAALVARQMGAKPSVGACIEPAPAAQQSAGTAFSSYRKQAADGNCLQGYAWVPAGRPVQAALVVVHGIHDHARRYAELAQALNEQGVAVYAQDHRGHGGSGGARQRVDSAAQLVQDTEIALREAALRHPGVPLFLHGHSMGGMVAAHYAADMAAQPAGRPALAGVVVSSAALKLPAAATAGTLRVVGTLSDLFPGLPLEAVDETQLVREAKARAALAADSIISREKLPARSAATVLQGIVGIQEKMASITAPLLILHGSADKVTEPAGSKELAERARSKDKILKIYEGAAHDLLHEPEQAQVRQEIGAFIAARVGAGKG